MEVCELKNRSDLFNNAVTLLEWAVEEVTKGREIAAFSESEQQILRMPCLDAASGKQFAEETSTDEN